MEPRPSKRARISLACLSCRDHKTRCDGEKPLCGCCRRRNPKSQNPCVYQNQAKARESKEIQNLLQRINQLEGGLAIEKPPNSSQDTDRSSSHWHSPADTSQPFGRGSVRNGANLFAASNISEARGRNLDGENNSPPQPQQNDEHLRGTLPQSLFGPDQRSPRFPHVQESAGPPQFRIPNLRQASTTDNTSGILEESMHRSSRFRTINAGIEVPVDSETSVQRPHAINHNQGTDRKSPQENDEPYFYGESSNKTLMQEVHDMISPSTRADPSSNTNSSRGEPSIYSALDTGPKKSVRNLHPNYLSSRLQMNCFELPPRSLADHLLESYFDRVYILYPFLHRPTFEAAYEKLWAPVNTRNASDIGCGLIDLSDAGLGNYSDSGPQSRVFYGGINAIFALSCQFSDLPISKTTEASNAYLERSMVLLLDSELLDNPTISLVQVLLLLCLHLQSTPLRNRLWNVIGMAVRMAQGLGLQVEDSEFSGNLNSKSSLEIEMRRRTWYGCVMLDITVSMTLGRTPMVSTGYSTPSPQPIDDENLRATTLISPANLAQPQVGISLTSFFVEAIKLSELTAKMVKVLYPEPSASGKIVAVGHGERGEDSAASFDILLDLETKWTDLYVNLPPELRWPEVKASSFDPPEAMTVEPAMRLKCLERQRNILHTRFLYVKILIYRPSLLQLCRQRIPQRNQEPGTLRPQQQPFLNPSPSSQKGSSPIQSYFATRCSIECFRTAEELIALVHNTHRTTAAGAWWYNIFYSYITGIIVILTRFCPPLTDSLGISCTDESWVLCQEILKDMGIYGSHANRCLASLQDLRARLASWESVTATNSFQDSRLEALPVVEGGVSDTWNPPDSNGIPVASAAHPEPESVTDWAGLLPWDADFDNWWTFDMVGAEFGPVPGFETSYT